jgi:hypothetical protein
MCDRGLQLEYDYVITARLITAPDGSTSGAIGFLQSWKEIEGENYAAPTTCVTLHTTIF